MDATAFSALVQIADKAAKAKLPSAYTPGAMQQYYSHGNTGAGLFPSDVYNELQSQTLKLVDKIKGKVASSYGQKGARARYSAMINVLYGGTQDVDGADAESVGSFPHLTWMKDKNTKQDSHVLLWFDDRWHFQRFLLQVRPSSRLKCGATLGRPDSLPHLEAGINGWPNGVSEAMASLVKRIEKVTMGMVRRPQYRLDYIGSAPDVATFMSGRLDCMGKYELAQKPDGEMRVVFNTSSGSATTVGTVIAGAIVVAMLNAAESMGYGTAVAAFDCGISGSGGIYMGLPVKKPGDPIDYDVLFYWMGHPSLLVDQFFSVWDRLPTRISRLVSGYGASSKLPKPFRGRNCVYLDNFCYSSDPAWVTRHVVEQFANVLKFDRDEMTAEIQAALEGFSI